MFFFDLFYKILYNKNKKRRYMFIFVYGTLKKGYLNHYLLVDAELIGKAKTIEKYSMYPSVCNNYPFAIESKKENFLDGEIYKIDKTIEKKLDILEGYPDLYIKKEIDVVLEKGEELKAIIYFKNEDTYISSADTSVKSLISW